MKRLLSLLILIVLISGCTEERCGDGVCDSFEKEHGICPEDCDFSEPVLYIGLMVHLEGWDDEDTNEQKFTIHAEATRKLAAIFEEYNARATFEAKPEFVRGCETWDNVLLELYNRGHGIGVHADVGGIKGNITQKEFTSIIAKMKHDMESVTNVDVRHISGICSTLDWVKAAVDAGYTFTTGSVGYCAMSLPVDKRPEQYRFCKNPAACHGVIPLDLKERIHPWRTNTGRNWLEHDPRGELVIFASDGGLKYLEEETRNTEKGEFTEKDIEAYIDLLEKALSYAEKDKINILYVSLSIGSPNIDETLYEKWFQAVQPYVDSGRVAWKTIPEMYDAYCEWESNQLFFPRWSSAYLVYGCPALLTSRRYLYAF